MINFIKSLQFIFKPSYWVMNYNYNKCVDVMVNDLLDRYEFEYDGEHVAKLGNAKIWISNVPYAAIRLYNTELEGFRPSRLTIQRGLNKLKDMKTTHESLVCLKVKKQLNLM